nr:protein multipolar spindle 1 isoform X2 [Tanacetum cinerariifolium]
DIPAALRDRDELTGEDSRDDKPEKQLIRSGYLFVLVKNNDEVTEQLRASVDFLVDLCDTISNPPSAATNFSLPETKSPRAIVVETRFLSETVATISTSAARNGYFGY